MKRALITGITGQDGSYLAEQLLEHGYHVHGIIRRSSSFNTARIDHLYHNPNLKLHYGDLCDASGLARLLRTIEPDEIYNLGAQSHVRVSFDGPEYTMDSIAMGTLRLLEAIRETGITPRFYQASSSEMFGKVLETPQTETTPFNPQSPYAVAKVAAHHLVRNYRDAYQLHASCGILFNHESERRGETFVTRKITRGLSRIHLGKEQKLSLGNLDAKRDWGYAPEYTRAMHLMLQQETPDDYVIATGETHTVREFAEKTCAALGIPLTWEGEGTNERGINSATGKTIIDINPRYFRPTEVDILLGNPAKARKKLGWQPRITFEQLVEKMVRADLEAERNGNTH